MNVIEGNQYIFQYEIKKTIATINYLGVQKRYRNKGIASKVVADFIQKCRKKGIKTIKIDCHKNSIRFWDKMGFEINTEPQIAWGVIQDYHDGILEIK
ncbi:GNAT family N-acetyltransferase [Aliarcobacter butzleri]|uniref:GNAT family N-acetyltransferase n=1 Tax=Aliarcobacter butzleri TaxID=28197 RepID=UPI0021B21593|nr:GNAT family N-acetyltransferase [Aliarcobacter butzleri]MCT7563304.1 GNAT family N-acetyltransferase [Aliarcobacter butzleri]MCT7578749.1 GNAT family N-acetyltransferase [Aliarcobacter butzleri]MCT7648918.1 GNAT family N-acetyltransferase [Aliarcobacter butzleri]